MVEAIWRIGPAWVWCTFPFKDANRYFEKINHGPNKTEIANILKIINAFYILRYKLSRKK